MTPKTPRVGRPRATPEADVTREDSVEDVILSAARNLFRTQGFSATTTREIAAAAGLRQPSMFHYFPNKMAMLEAVALAAIEPEAAFVEAEKRRGDGPDVALYRYTYFIVCNLSTNPNVMGRPEQFPELTRAISPTFWRHYDLIYGYLQKLLRAGRRARLFVSLDTDTMAQQLFALIEAPLAARPLPVKRAIRNAEIAAELVLRAVLEDPERLSLAKASPPAISR